jgi:hypothetical protein
MVVDELFTRECLARWIEFGSPAGRPTIVDTDDSNALSRDELTRVS